MISLVDFYKNKTLLNSYCKESDEVTKKHKQWSNYFTRWIEDID